MFCTSIAQSVIHSLNLSPSALDIQGVLDTGCAWANATVTFTLPGTDRISSRRTRRTQHLRNQESRDVTQSGAPWQARCGPRTLRYVTHNSTQVRPSTLERPENDPSPKNKLQTALLQSTSKATTATQLYGHKHLPWCWAWQQVARAERAAGAAEVAAPTPSPGLEPPSRWPPWAPSGHWRSPQGLGRLCLPLTDRLSLLHVLHRLRSSAHQHRSTSINIMV